MPVAVAVFAVSVGILFGTWFKKIIPALGAALLLLMAAQVIVPLLARTHYAKPVVYTTNSLFSENGGHFKHRVPNGVGAWTISEKMVNNKGEVFEWGSPPAACKVADPEASSESTKEAPPDQNQEKRHAIIGRNNVFLDVNCLDSLGYHWEVKYQPSYRYWDFQPIESGLYVTLALIALGGTYALVLRRDA